MASSFPSLVYGKNPSPRSVRAVMDGSRASFSRSLATIPVARPAQPSSWSDVRSILPHGFRIAPHRGIAPWLTDCVCDCHGNNDSSGRTCDVSNCVDVLSAC